ncbi:hypothetical protein HOA92_00940 [archaeon]|mgnify:CR=1 FL=1|jgi:hypothetical protein|nr:hypothetical protein [archaeon]MBT6761584.1 hypothetical protein [archaeon]
MIKTKPSRTPIMVTLIAGAALANTADAGTVELMAGNGSTTLDIQMPGKLAEKIGYFSRTRFTKDYDGDVSAFGAVDLTYSIGSNVDLLLETQFAQGLGVVPRPGVQYIKTSGDLTVVGLLTGSHNLDLEPHLVVRYDRELNERFGLMGQVELLTNFGIDGHNFSLQRLRAGASHDGYTLGVASDFIESENFGYNVGGFLEKGF